MLFANIEFLKMIETKLIKETKITMKEVTEELDQMISTNSCIEASLWTKITDYMKSNEDDERLLGEFIHYTDMDKKCTNYYSVKIGKIYYMEAISYLIRISDITSNKKAQRESLNKKYKNILLTTASHELRTPLNGIIGVAQLLMKEKSSDSMKYYKILESSCKLLNNIIDDMLDYCLYESGSLALNISEVKLKTMFKEAIRVVGEQSTYRAVKLILNIDDDIPEIIHTDNKRLMQILLNLLGNATKYTFKGSITLYAKNMEHDVLIKVIDTGIGLNEEKKQGLFKLFGSINSDVKNTNDGKIVLNGSGLGLTVSQVLASLLGTGITLESEESKGSEFSFTISKELKDKKSNSEICLPVKRKKRYLRGGTTFLNKDNGKTLPDPFKIEKKHIESIPINNIMQTNSDIDTSVTNTDEGAVLKRSLARYAFEPSYSPKKRINSGELIRSKTLFKSRNCFCPNILIVDDNAFNLMILENMLAKLNLVCISVCL